MSRREELADKYAGDIGKLGMEVDRDLLLRCIKACGPSVYSADSETVAASDPEELARVRRSLLTKRFGMAEGPDADAALNRAIDTYGRSNRNKYRAVMYYILAVQTGNQAKV